MQDGRIHIELINGPFLNAGGTVAEYRAGIERAIANGWLWRHESGVYVKFTSAGADAQRMLDAPTHEIAAFSDMVKIGNLVDDCAEDVGEALRYAGYQRSKELLELHRAKIERLAEALAERMELDRAVIGQILTSDGGAQLEAAA